MRGEDERYEEMGYICGCICSGGNFRCFEWSVFLELGGCDSCRNWCDRAFVGG